MEKKKTEIVRTLREDALRLMSVNSAKNDFMSGLKIIVLCMQKIRKISHDQIDLAIESLSEVVELYADLEIVYVSHTSHELSATDDFRERIKHLCDGVSSIIRQYDYKNPSKQETMLMYRLFHSSGKF